MCLLASCATYFDSTPCLRHLVNHLSSDVVQSSLLGPALLLFPCTCMSNIFSVATSPHQFVLNELVSQWHLGSNVLMRICSEKRIPSQSSLSEEGCHCSMLASLHMSSFLMWSFLVLRLDHLSILVSALRSFCVSFSWMPSIQTRVALLAWLWFCAFYIFAW